MPIEKTSKPKPKSNVLRMMHRTGVIFSSTMCKLFKNYLVVFLLCNWNCNLFADVYGGGYWETIGLGNMSCEQLSTNANEKAHRELVAVWLSGFMSGINFTSVDIYDITWGEDLYVLADLVNSKCEAHPDKIISDIASDLVYTRYKDKNFKHIDDVNP